MEVVLVCLVFRSVVVQSCDESRDDTLHMIMSPRVVFRGGDNIHFKSAAQHDKNLCQESRSVSG